MSQTYDVRLKLGSVMMVCGPSQCGKTVFVNNLLQQYDTIFNPPPKHIIWHYGEIIPEHRLKHVHYVGGLPETENIKQNSIIVIDDLFLEAAKSDSITNLFTRVSHHRRCFIIFITQNLYHSSKSSRTRSLNTHYLVLFKNIRDNTVIHTLARQMYPSCGGFLVEAFRHATTHPYSYIFLDLRTETPDVLRVRANIILGESIDIYINKANTIQGINYEETI